MIVGLESNSKIFTVSVQGLLELQVSRHAHMKYQCLWTLSASLGCIFLRRRGSTPPYLWITQQAPPLQYRTVQILWACCLVYSLTHELGHRPIRPPPRSLTFSMDRLWAPPHSSEPQGRSEGRKWGWHSLDCWVSMVKGQCEELKDCFSTCTACCFTDKLKIKRRKMSVSVYFSWMVKTFAVNRISTFLMSSGEMLVELGSLKKHLCVYCVLTFIFFYRLCKHLWNIVIFFPWIKSLSHIHTHTYL